MTATAEQITALKAKGYIVEDMGAVYGPECDGEFRFLNEVTGDFQDGHTSCLAQAAWDCCVAFDAKYP